jgi:inhibitor of KinA
MTQMSYKIVPLSESAVVVEFGRTTSVELNDKALRLAASLELDRFPGFIEAVPAYASTTIFYNPIAVRKHFSNLDSAFETMADLLAKRLDQPKNAVIDSTRIVEIPVDFSEEHSLDMTDISLMTGLKHKEIIKRFLAKTYRVYMVGFLPGFAYMGEVDESIAVPRKETPRTAVPKGSVGIAGKQTGIYPLESPGGWQIIGLTHLEMFTPVAESPCLLKPGDEVRFVSE